MAILFDSIIMLRFEKAKASRKIMVQRNQKNICDVNADNIVISKLFQTKTNAKYLSGYLE